LKKSLLILLLYSIVVYCQVRSDSLVILGNYSTRKNISSSFDKQLNTYNLRSILTYGQRIDNLFFVLSENFNSTIIKLKPKNIKDEHYFSFFSEYTFSKFFSTGLVLNNNILADDKNLGLSDASLFNSVLYAKFITDEKISLATFGGITANEQVKENDKGYIYGIEGKTDYIQVSDFELQSSLKLENDDISPRKNTLRYFDVNMSNNLDEHLNNQLSANYQQSRRDFYFKADSSVINDFKLTNNIQSRTESNYFIQDRIAYLNPASKFKLDLLTRIVWRDIDRDTRYRSLNNISQSMFDVKVNEFRLEFESFVGYRSDLFDGKFKFFFSERDEKHVAKRINSTNIFQNDEIETAFEERSKKESQKNNTAGRFSLAVNGGFRISSKDSLQLDLLHNKLKYDTPSSDNFDDRDELLTIVRLKYLRTLSPFFNAFVNIEGSINHIVYIFSERSSNNNKQSILRLNTGGVYNSNRFYSKNLFEVSANYTVYDFEDVNANYKSFSFRQLSMMDSTSIKITKKVFSSLYTYLKYSEQGDFKWSGFSGKPIRDLLEIYFEPKLNVKYLAIVYGIGIRYLTLKTYLYKNLLKNRESDYSSIGPLAEANVSVNSKLLLRFYGWYEFIKTEDSKRKEQANVNLQLIWSL
jgi:hypothetical protein